MKSFDEKFFSAIVRKDTGEVRALLQEAKKYDLLLVSQFDTDQLQEIKGYAIILANNKTACLIVDDKIVMQGDKLHMVENIDRLNIDPCDSIKPIKYTDSEFIKREIIEEFTLKTNYIIDINAINRQKQTPIMVAVRYPEPEIIQLILNHPIKPNLTLKNSSNRRLIDYLQSNTALDIELRREISRRYLFQLIKKDDRAEIILLKEMKQIDFATQDAYGNTAVHCLARYNRTALIDLFVANLEPESRNKEFETPIEVAAYYGKLEMVIALLEKNSKVHRILTIAIRAKQAVLLKSLLTSKYHEKLFKESKESFSELLYGAVISDQSEMIQILTDYMPKERQVLYGEITMVQHASTQKKYKSLKKLLELGYSIDKSDLPVPRNLTAFSDGVKIGILRQQLESYQLKTYQLILTDFLINLRNRIKEIAKLYLKQSSPDEVDVITRPQVFFSYAWEKVGTPELEHLHQFLRRFREDLIRAGLRVFYDEQNMSGNIETQMGNNVRNSNHIIFFGTKKYQERTQPGSNSNVRKEFDFTLTEAKQKPDVTRADFIFPLLLEGSFEDNPFPKELGDELIRFWQGCFIINLNVWMREDCYIENLMHPSSKGVLFCLLGLNKLDQHKKYREESVSMYSENYKALQNKLNAEKQKFEHEFKQSNVGSRFSVFPQAHPTISLTPKSTISAKLPLTRSRSCSQ